MRVCYHFIGWLWVLPQSHSEAIYTAFHSVPFPGSEHWPLVALIGTSVLMRKAEVYQPHIAVNYLLFYILK